MLNNQSTWFGCFKLAIICSVFTGIVSGCTWQNDFRVHEKPEDHARMMDYKEFLEPKDPKAKKKGKEDVVEDPSAPPMVLESFEDKAQHGRLEETITETFHK